MKKININLYTIVAFLSFASLSGATQETNWLASYSQLNGSIQVQNNINKGNDFQSTAAALETFIHFNDFARSEFQNGLDYLLVNHNNQTERLAKILHIQASSSIPDPQLINNLLTRINSDGGMGEDDDFESNTLDSAFALMAFTAIGTIDQQIVENLINYLRLNKNNDSGYSLSTSNDSSVYLTSLVATALSPYSNSIPNVNASLVSSNQFLLSQQLQLGGWAETYKTALSLIGLKQSNYEYSNYWLSIQQLRNSKTNNLQWDNDVYTTALALMAEGITSEFTAPITRGSVTGTIIDSATQQPLEGVSVSVMGLNHSEVFTNSSGQYNINNIPDGWHNYDVIYPGYIPEAFAFLTVDGNSNNLGSLAIIKNPNTGLLKGVVSDIDNHIPINGALVEINSNSTVILTNSNSLGHYQIELPTGDFNVTVSSNHFSTITIDSTIQAAQTIDFSPSLSRHGVGISNTAIKGRVIASDTNFPIENAKVTVLGDTIEYFTDTNGEYTISYPDTGIFELTITADTYYSATKTILSGGGIVDLRDIALVPTNIITSSTLFGTIKDATTRNPIQGVSIVLPNSGLSALSDVNGYYIITDIPALNYQVQFSIPGYQSLNYELSSNNFTTSELNVELQTNGSSSLIILEFLPDSFEYAGAVEVDLDIELRNTYRDPISTRLYLRILNDSNEIVAYYPVKEIPFNGTVTDTIETLQPYQTINTTASWNTRFQAPGDYQIDLLAFDENSEELIRQASTTITLLPIKVVSGSVKFNPDATNFDPNQLIEISAQLYDSGSLAIGNVDVTANVYLVDKKDNSDQLSSTVTDEFSSPLLANPTIMQKDSNNELLIYSADTNNIVKFKNDETFELLFNTGGYIRDFVLNSQDQVHTIDHLCHVKIFDATGNVINDFPLGFSGCTDLEVLNNDNDINIVSDTGIYNLEISTGTLTQIAGNYLKNPQGMIKHTDGRLIIADGLANTLLSYENNSISAWVSGFSNPHGICEDTDSSVLVANYGNNEIIRVALDGTKTILASGIPTPYDIKLNPAGGYYVSSETENKLYQVNNDGSFTVIYDSYINVPRILVSGNNSDVYIYNSADQTLIRRLNDGTVIELGTPPHSVSRMFVDQLDNLILISGGRFYRQESDLSFTQLSNTGVTVATIIDGDLTNEYRFFESFSNQFGYIDAAGNITFNDIKKPFNSVTSLKTDSTGLIYILDGSRIMTIDQNLNYNELITGLGSTFDLYISPTDDLYVSKHSKEIIRIDSSLNITTIATVTNSPRKFVINNTGEVIYSDLTNTLYTNDGVTESVFKTLNANISGGLAIDGLDRIWVTYRHNLNNVTVINTNLSTIEVPIDAAATGVYYPTSIALDNSNGAWISTRDGVIYIDSTGNHTTTYQSTETQTTGALVVSNGDFYIASAYKISHFDASFSYQNTYSNFSRISDMVKQTNGDIIIATISPHRGIIKYSSFSTLPEYIKNGGYNYLEKSNTSNHILGYSTFGIEDIDIVNKNSNVLISDVGFTTDFAQVNGTEIHLINYIKNQYSIYDYQAQKQFNLFGLTNLQGLVVDDNNDLYLTDSKNSYKFIQNNEIELFNLDSGGYMDYHSGAIYKRSTYGEFLNITNISTGESNNYTITESGYLSNVLYESDHDIKVINARGIVKVDLTGPNEILINSIDNLDDILQLDTGEIYLGSDNNADVGGILQLSNGIFSKFKSNRGLFGITPDSLTYDSEFLYAYSDREVANNVVQIGSSNRLIINPFVLPYLNRLSALQVIGNDLYGINGSNKLLKAQIDDPLQQHPLIGELVHSSTISTHITSNETTLNFASFTPPISGEYEVKLTFSDSEIISEVTDQLHVGNLATGQITFDQTQTTPGDVVIGTNTNIDGLDITSAVELITEQTRILYNFVGSIFTLNNFAVADNEDVYYLTGNSDILHKVDQATQIDSVIYNSPYYILNIIKDHDGKIVLLGHSTSPTVWINPDGTVAKEMDFNDLFGIRISNSGDVDSNNNLIVQGSMSGGTNSLFKIDTVNSTYSLIQENIPGDANLWVTSNDNIYLLGKSITMYNPNTHEYKIIKNSIGTEGGTGFYESSRIAIAVCEDTTLFTEPLISEEHEIFSGGARRDLIFNEDDGSVLQTSGRITSADFESLHYDKNNSSLIIYEDMSGNLDGRFITVPINCGKMYVELHLTDQTNTSLSDFNINPDQTIEVAQSTHEYIWIVDGLDTVQKIFNFQTHVNDLLPNESRPILSGAYLKFKNGLDPQQDLIVNLDIPSILGVIDRDLTVTLDNNEYQGNSDIHITAGVDNTALSVFDGKVLQHIEDANGNLVVSLGQQNITNLAAQTQLDIPVVWNTLNYYAGQYQLISQLFDNNDKLQDEVNTPFTIIASEVNASAVELHILTNKTQFSTIDQVELSLSITNLSDNNILNAHQAQLLITDPNGVVIYQQTVDINNLSSQAIQSWQDTLNLNQAIVGTYTISLNLIDNNGVTVANQSSIFEVVLDAQVSLSGTVTVAIQQIQPPTNNSCHFELTNTAVQNIVGIEIHQTVVNLSNQLTMQDDTLSIDLNAGATWSNDQSIDTSALSSGDHACTLRTIINGQEKTQASAIFFVQGANQLSGMLWNDTNGNAIIDNTEVGIDGIELKLYDNAQQLLQTTNTANNGHYQFTAITNGQYSIEVAQAGTIATYLITTANNPAVLTINNGHQSLNFGYQAQIGSASGIIWNDVNANQSIDNGETFYPNININLLDSSNTVVDSTQSDNDGIFAFLDKATGQYTLSVVDSSGVLMGLNNTTNNNPQSIDIMTPPQVSDTFFGFRQDINDISVDDSSCLIAINENTPINMTINIKNLGNTDINQAQFVNSLSAGLTNISWSCQAYNGASCTATGTNTITDTIDLPQSSSLVYSIHAEVTAVLQDTVNTSYTLTMPNGISDDNPANNTGQKSYKVLYLQNPQKLFDSSFECISVTSTQVTSTQVTTEQVTKSTSQKGISSYTDLLKIVFKPWVTNGKLWIQIYKQMQTIAQQQNLNNLLTTNTKITKTNTTNWNSYAGEAE